MTNVLVALREGLYGSVLLEEDLDRLREKANVTVRKDLMHAGEGKLIEALKDADAEAMIIGWQSPKVTTDVLAAWPKLKLVAHTAGELSHYVTREALEQGLAVTNWGHCTAHSTAEGALAMTLALLRHYHKMPYWMDEGLFWDLPEQDEGLFEQRVGLHGLGAIAQEYAKLIRPFDCRVSAYSPHCPDEIFEELGVERAESLKELYGENRIISCHASLRPDTLHIVNAEVLSLIEDGGYFINTSRGGVVDTEALIAELEAKRIHAALDVFEEEPLPEDSRLRSLENCFVVPHRAGPTPDRQKVMGRHAVDNVIAYIEGGELDGVVDAKKFDLMT